MNSGNVGIDLPKPRRPTKGSNDGTLDFQSIEDWMASIEANTGAIGKEVATLARIAKALLSAGLTKHAISLLIQDQFPKTRRGNPTISLQQIIDVLEAAANLDVHLSPDPTNNKRAR